MKKHKLRQLTAVMGEGVVRPAQQVVSADDLGLTRGDGCFDATRVRTFDDGISEVDNLDEHLERLAASVHGLGAPEEDLESWRELVANAVDSWSLPGEAVLKLLWTRGRESVPTDPVRMLTITPIAPATVQQRSGVRLVTLGTGRSASAFEGMDWLLGGVKTLSYAVNKAALREASTRGVDDVLFTSSDGWCLEGPTAALLVARDRTLTSTPPGPSGVLDSITRRVVYRAATADGWSCADSLVRPADLASSRGAWLLSSVRGAAPIVKLDGVQLPFDADLHAQVTRWAGF